MHQWTPGGLRGLKLVDADGRRVGSVESTYPLDGSSPEFAIVNLGRFGMRVMVPLAEAWQFDHVLEVPFSRRDIEDAPSLDSARYMDDAVSRARGYWSLVDRDEPSGLMPMPL